jgi:RNA polymerase sigma factor (sigma-70 family)
MSSNTKVALKDSELSDAIENHREKLRALIGRKIRDQVEAEDILQDVFEEYVEATDLGEVIETLGAWLVRVAQNKIIDRFRRKKTQQDYFLENPMEGEAITSSDPEDEMMRAFLREEIVEALSMLPENQRTVFVQHELEGKSFEEIAAETGVNINTLLARKRYAIQFLREHLKEIYDELE